MASIEEFAEGLIKSRIASGLSQRTLVQRLELKEQQIQRFELTAGRAAWGEALANTGGMSNAVSGHLAVNEDIALRFAREVAEMQADDELIRPVFFNVGSLLGIGEQLEMWMFCAEADPCLGYANGANDFLSNASPVELFG